MRTHDQEPELPEGHSVQPRHDEDDPLAPLALTAGRTEALGAGAVLGLQRSAGNASVAGMLADETAPEGEAHSPVKDVVGSGRGAPLDAETRGLMESRMGHDFSDVRVHTDAQATESARSVGAHAYTVGTDVVFQADRWSPGSPEGQRTLAHELTHVVQQKAGPVDGTPAPGGISISDPSDSFEREADQTADAVIRAPAASDGPGPAAAPTGVQRQADEEMPEEETAQGTFVQRQADEEMPEEDLTAQGCFVGRQAADEEQDEEPAAG